MLFSEIIKMALASLGANKLRAALNTDLHYDRQFLGDLGDDRHWGAAVLH